MAARLASPGPARWCPRPSAVTPDASCAGRTPNCPAESCPGANAVSPVGCAPRGGVGPGASAVCPADSAPPRRGRSRPRGPRGALGVARRPRRPCLSAALIRPQAPRRPVLRTAQCPARRRPEHTAMLHARVEVGPRVTGKCGAAKAPGPAHGARSNRAQETLRPSGPLPGGWLQPCPLRGGGGRPLWRRQVPVLAQVRAVAARHGSLLTGRGTSRQRHR